MITLYASGAAGTGSSFQMPETRQAYLVVDVLNSNAQVIGTVGGQTQRALPAFNITGSSTTLVTDLIANNIYIVPNVGGLSVKVQVAGSGSVLGNTVIF